MARFMRAQVPRAVTTSLPWMTESWYSLSLQPSEMVPFAFRRTTIDREVPSLKMASLEFCATRVDPVESARLTPGKEECDSWPQC